MSNRGFSQGMLGDEAYIAAYHRGKANAMARILSDRRFQTRKVRLKTRYNRKKDRRNYDDE